MTLPTLFHEQQPNLPTFATVQEQAKLNPEAYWLAQAKAVSWFKAPTQAHQYNVHNHSTWFADGELNTAWLCLDHHVAAGRGEQTAVIYDSPVTQTVQHISYAELLERVARIAGVLVAHGIGYGDRVIIYMPMIPEALVAMLACARVGAIHSVVFGGFAAPELATRINDAKPKAILTASCGLEINKIIAYQPMVNQACILAETPPQFCLVFQRPQCRAELTAGRDLDWASAEAAATPAEALAVKGSDPLYILYTSGTTGTPKGVVRDHGGHAVALLYSMRVVYDMQPGQVFWTASDVGWVVGHSYIVYAPLLAGCTTVLYEGKPVRTPDAGAFWRVVQDHKVTALFSAPTAFRAIKKEDPEAQLLQHYNISSLKRLYLAGERLDPATYHWLKTITGLPVLDHWWQTETGWAIACNPVGIAPQPEVAGSATFPTPGFQVEILQENGQPCATDQQGDVCIRMPLPPGCLTTIWQNQERFESGYLNSYPGYYLTGDGGYIDAQGYLFIMGRIDDVINVAGHRLSTGEMEQVIAEHKAVAECAVFGISDALKGQRPLALVVLKDGAQISAEALQHELVQAVRNYIGAVAFLREVLVVERLPKTRSGKILRRTLRELADGGNPSVPSTIDDPAIIDELHDVLSSFRAAHG